MVSRGRVAGEGWKIIGKPFPNLFKAFQALQKTSESQTFGCFYLGVPVAYLWAYLWCHEH